MLFNNLNLTENILAVLAEMGFIEPTEIQEKCIPLILTKKDVVGLSQTGSGKTFAFGLPIIQNIDKELGGVQALIVSPTRELALQTTNELKKFSSITGVKVVAVYGGADINRQITSLKKANIVVGTPGRIMDHLDRRTLKLGLIKTVVLDEADEMLNMGFRDDIEKILKSAPSIRQTLMFSATMPPEIMTITKNYMIEPAIIRLAQRDEQGKTNQYYLNVKRGKKMEVLVDLLHELRPRLSLVFCNTKRMVDDLQERLDQENFLVAGLHGDKRQSERKRVMDAFKSGEKNVLIATDVAARGIDVKGIECVFNYDLPYDIEYYTHRIGRTGRAGGEGDAYSLVSGSAQYENLMDFVKKLNAPLKEYSPKNLENISKKEGKEMDSFKEKREAPKPVDFVGNFVSATKKTVSEKAKSTHLELTTLGYDDKQIADILIDMLASQKAPIERTERSSYPRRESHFGDRKPSFKRDERRDSNFSDARRPSFQRDEKSSSYLGRKPSFNRDEKSGGYADRKPSFNRERNENTFDKRDREEIIHTSGRKPFSDRSYEKKAPRSFEHNSVDGGERKTEYRGRSNFGSKPFSDRNRTSHTYSDRKPRPTTGE
ncbi:MAG: DEAD/DEAH box helicase [Clostridia bacterium]|jgi:ATP-dependent RNA helicase DeaD|nr:DEAD/DEAH box helicase [Clostridia bacterium]